MAAATEKKVYAVEHTCHGGKLFRPGELMTGKAPDYAIQGALESGVASDVASHGEAARKAEAERRGDVHEQMRTRSDKRESNKR